MQAQILNHSLRAFSAPQKAHRHAMGIAFVVTIHVALITALWNMGVIDFVLPKADPPLVVIDVPPPVKPVEPPVEQRVKPAPDDRVYMPEPIIDVETNPSPERTIGGGGITNVPPTPVADTPLRRLNLAKIPPYPPIERRLGHEGTVSLRVVVSETGAISDVSILKSSGFPRLDEAAIAWITREWRFQPATREGHPVVSATRADVQFKLVY